MLSNKENRFRMRCKLVENPYSDSHFEASRLRDYSGIDQQPSDNSPTTPDSKIPREDDELLTSEDDLNTTSTKSTSNNTGKVDQETTTPDRQFEDKEKIVLIAQCELVTMTRSISGRFELTNKYIYFFDLSNSSFSSLQFDTTKFNNQTINDNYSAFYASIDGMMNQSYSLNTNDLNTYNDFKISLQQLREVQLRRFNLRSSALEFFLIDQSNFFINFEKNVRNFVLRYV